MYTLAFDTTTNFCSVALLKDQNVIERFDQEMDFGQAEALIVQIKKMLEKENLLFSALGLVVVCTGPGSFTGVRSSISAARAFSIASAQTVVAGVNAFEVYLSALSDEALADVNVVLIETKRDDFYWCCFDQNRKKITEPSAAYYDEIIRFLSGKKVTLTGDGVERFLNKPSGLCLKTVELPSQPCVECLARVGLEKFEACKIDFPKPMYLKAPDVCVK